MSREWMLRRDTHWVARRLDAPLGAGSAPFVSGEEALYLIKAARGDCVLSLNGEPVRLAGSRMLLADGSLSCAIREAGGDLALETIELRLDGGGVPGESARSLCEKYPEFLRFCLGDPGPVVFDDAYALVIPMAENLEAFSHFEKSDGVLFTHLYLTYILLVIVCAFEEGRRFEATGNRHVRKALRYIEEHYMSNLTAQEIAREVGVHPVYLHRLFYEETGRRINEYILEKRLRHADFLLIHTPLGMAEIARLTGFSSQQYLSRVFRRARGVTPAGFRSARSITCFYPDKQSERREETAYE